MCERRLGHQGYRLIQGIGIDATGDTQPPIETPAEFRARIRHQLEHDTRPPIGTSELLSRPFTQETVGVGGRDVVLHDLVGMMPIHLKRGAD